MPRESRGARFRAWVPNVSGRLSFTAFGGTKSPRAAITANVNDGDTRLIITYQARNTSDVTLPLPDFLEEWVSRNIFKRDGKFWFLLVAETHAGISAEREYLSGRIFVFWPKVRWRKTVEPTIQRLQELLFRYSISPKNHSLKSYSHRTYQMLCEKFSHMSVFYCDFSVGRSGTSDIIVPDDMFVSKKSPFKFADSKEYDDLQRMFVSQCFYFLRDAGHRHQHHHPTTDTIVEAVPIHRKDDNDYEWRLDTLYNMYRKIIDLKRNPGSINFSNSLGVLAYAKSFRKISIEELPEYKSRDLPKYFDDEMSESIRSAENRFLRDINIKENRRSGVRTWFFQISMLMLGLIGALIIGIDGTFKKNNITAPHDDLVFLANFVLKNPYITFIIILNALFALHLAARATDIIKNPYLRKLYRILTGLKLRVHFMIAMGIFGLFSAIAGSVLYFITLY